MRHASRKLTTLALSWVALAMFLAVDPARSATEDEIIDCYKTYASTYFCDTFGNCSLKFKYLPAKFRLLQRCAGELFKCQVRQEGTGRDESKCFEKADKKCERLVEETLHLGTLKFPSQREQVIASCSELDFQDEILGVSGGLGFTNSASGCSAVGVPLGDVADLTACADQWLQSQMEALYAFFTPRAQDLLSANGWVDDFSPASNMLPALPGDADGTNEKAVRSCQRRFYKTIRTFLQRKMIIVEDCADELLRCEIKQDPSCFAAAESYCNNKLQKVTKERAKMEARFVSKCSVDVNTLRVATGIATPGHQCSSVSNSEELASCMSDWVSCWTDDMAEQLLPRAAELYQAHGLAADFECLP